MRKRTSRGQLSIGHVPLDLELLGQDRRGSRLFGGEKTSHEQRGKEKKEKKGKKEKKKGKKRKRISEISIFFFGTRLTRELKEHRFSPIPQIRSHPVGIGTQYLIYWMTD